MLSTVLRHFIVSEFLLISEVCLLSFIGIVFSFIFLHAIKERFKIKKDYLTPRILNRIFLSFNKFFKSKRKRGNALFFVLIFSSGLYRNILLFVKTRIRFKDKNSRYSSVWLIASSKYHSQTVQNVTSVKLKGARRFVNESKQRVSSSGRFYNRVVVCLNAELTKTFETKILREL